MESSSEIMTPEEFKRHMEAITAYEIDRGHFEADVLMCDLLKSLGYSAGIEIYENMPKWYQ